MKLVAECLLDAIKFEQMAEDAKDEEENEEPGR